MLFFEGYPSKAEDLQDHYHWTLLDDSHCRLGRDGTIQARITRPGFYTAAWDWAFGPPRQRVHVMAFGPVGWGRNDGVAPLAVYIVPVPVDVFLFNRTMRHLCEVLMAMPQQGGMPMCYVGGTVGLNAPGAIVELGRPVVVRVGGVEHTVPAWDGVAQCVSVRGYAARSKECTAGVVCVWLRLGCFRVSV